MVREPGWNPITVHGVGLALPGRRRVCRRMDEFSSAIMSGDCMLTPYDEFDTGVRVAGQVPEDVGPLLGIGERSLSKLPRVSRLAHLAVADAMEHARITPEELSRSRSVLIVTSIQFALRETADLLRRYQEKGASGVGLDYWISGTPGSIASCLSTNLGLDMPTLSLTGGCSTSLRGFQLASSMITSGEVDHAIVVGADCVLEPLFLSSTSYEGRSGFRASTASTDPGDVRPHDMHQNGNAPGEGAVALVLGAPGTSGGDWATAQTLGTASRKRGTSPVGLGDPVRFAEDISGLVERGVGAPSGLALVNDFAEGSRFLEDFLCDVLDHLESTVGGVKELTLTSQEAVFGHIPGAAGLLKVVSNLVMLKENRVAPTANLVTPYDRLTANVAFGEPSALDPGRETALAIATSGGGDTSSLLLRLL